MTSESEPDAPVVLARIEITYQIMPGGQPDVEVYWDDTTSEDDDDRMLLQFMGMLSFAEKTIWGATVRGEGE